MINKNTHHSRKVQQQDDQTTIDISSSDDSHHHLGTTVRVTAKKRRRRHHHAASPKVSTPPPPTTTSDWGDNDVPPPRALIDPKEKIKTMYATHPYLLYFTDPATEQRYFDFQYVDNSFIPGKMFVIMWVGLTASTFILFSQPLSNDAAYTVEAFTSPWWFALYITTILNALLSIGLFINSLRQYREMIHLAQIFLGFPSIILLVLYTKRPHAYNYGQLLGCSFFAMFIVQCRLFRSLPFVTLWPVVCMLAVTFGVPEYWDHHTYVEMLYWGIFLMPVLLLFFLEKQTRKSFRDKELATDSIAEIEHKTAVTQRMIANFFPKTPTTDLLHEIHGSREKAYPNTVMIMTDVVGFAAYTSRSNPHDVVASLTDMFRSFDSTADFFGVEKIATVGDSYCGAVFPRSGKTDGGRCVSAILFSVSTLNGSSLHHRVGVHIGDIVGTFVGRAPPKFDLFGPGIDHARLMQETGKPDLVHVSSTSVDCIGTQPDNVTEFTPFGVLCSGWDNLSSYIVPRPTSLRWTSRGRREEYNRTIDTACIVEALCSVSGIEPPSASTAAATANTAAMLDDMKSQSSGDSSDVIDKGDYEFHPIYLGFEKKSIEVAFQAHILAIGVNDYCCRLFLGFTLGLYVLQLNLQCGEERDMGISSAMLGLIAGLSCYVQFFGTNHRFHFVITWLSYNVLFMMALLGLAADCGGLELREKYVGDIAACYLCIAIFAPQYCLDVRLVYRCLMTVSSCVLWIVCVVFRRNTIRDEVAIVDPLPIMGSAFIIMSFFPEYSLRSAFRTENYLVRLQKVAKSRGAAMATSALSIMLPMFVTEKIVALTIDQANEFESNVADLDFNGVAATWEYSHAVVMFAKFHSDEPAFTPEAIDMTVQAVEQIMRRFKVMKVKTIGSTIMLVAGIDDPRTRQEQLTGIVDAAIMIRACVFQQMNVPNLVHRIGVHCGPCFGAVIGGNGAIFDLFGDTVNTASRMMSSATPGAIQLSEAANALLHPRLRDVVDADETVAMRGGSGAVYSVREPRGDVLNNLLSQDLAATPLNSRPTSSTPTGMMRRAVLSNPATNPFSKTSAVEAWRSTWAKESGNQSRPLSPVVDESHDLGPLLAGGISETQDDDEEDSV